MNKFQEYADLMTHEDILTLLEMNVEEVWRLVGVIVHPIHGGSEVQYLFLQQLLLELVDMTSLKCIGNIGLTPGAQFLQTHPRAVHCML